MIKLSIVIPTYNMGDYLERSLNYLSAQNNDFHDLFEVVVVDDGSSDDTGNVADKYAGNFQHFSYNFKPRDNTSCRAAARNLGISKCTGDHIMFMDSGVIVTPDFVQKQIAFCDAYPNDVLIHHVIGLFASPQHEAMGLLEQAGPSTLQQAIAELQKFPIWCDEREEIYELVNNDLTLLPAPWALSWTCALAAPRQKILQIEGFDESFIGWGGEDIDFGFRLHEAGCTFRTVGNSITTVHWPHAPLEPGAKPQTPKFHKKHQKLETGILSLLDGYHANHFMLRLESLVIKGMRTPVPVEIQNAIQNIQNDGNTHLIMGSSDVSMLLQLPKTSHIMLHRKSDTLNVQQLLSEVAVQHSLCIATQYGDSHFNSLILFDVVGYMPPALRDIILEEALRISERVFVVCCSEQKRAEKSRLEGVETSLFLGWRYWTNDELKDSFQKHGGFPEAVSRADNAVLYEIQKSA